MALNIKSLLTRFQSNVGNELFENSLTKPDYIRFIRIASRRWAIIRNGITLRKQPF